MHPDVTPRLDGSRRVPRRVRFALRLAGLLALMVGFILVLGPGAPWDDGRTTYVIRPGQEEAVKAALIDPEHKQPFSPYEIRGILIRQSRIEVVFALDERETTRIVLVHPDSDPMNPLSTPDVAIRAGADRKANDLARLVHQRLASTSLEDLWEEIPVPGPPLPPELQSDSTLGWVWLFLGLLIFWLGLGLGSEPTPTKEWAFALGVLGVSAWLLRLHAGSPSPGDPSILHLAYGHGQAALLLGLPVPLTVDTVFIVARTLGSFAPVFLALAVHARTGDRRLAMIAGILLAIQPLLVRFSSDFTRQSYVLFLGTVSLWALARWLAHPSAVALALYVSACLLCIETRPEALLILPITAAFAWPGHPWRRATLAVFVVQVPLAVRAALRFPSGTLGNTTFDFDWIDLKALFFDTDYTSIIVQILFLVGSIMAAWRRDRTVLSAMAGLLLVQLATADRNVDGPNLLFARFHTLGFPPFAFVAACGLRDVCEVFKNTGFHLAARISVWILVGVSSIGPLREIVTPRTLSLEFQYLLRTIPALPLNAKIYYPYTNRDMGFNSFPVLSHLVGRPDLLWKVWPPSASPKANLRFFYLHSLCNSSPVRPIDAPPASDPRQGTPTAETKEFERVCSEAIQRRVGPPVFEEHLQTRSFHHEFYRGQKVRVGFLPLAAPAKSEGRTSPAADALPTSPQPVPALEGATLGNVTVPHGE